MVSSLSRTDGDQRDLASTESELGRRFPVVTVEVIHTLVQASYERLTPAKVHNYLAILVSREVQAELRALQPV